MCMRRSRVRSSLPSRTSSYFVSESRVALLHPAPREKLRLQRVVEHIGVALVAGPAAGAELPDRAGGRCRDLVLAQIILEHLGAIAGSPRAHHAVLGLGVGNRLWRLH